MAVDQAVWNFGAALASQLHEAESKAKNERTKKAARIKVFKKWLPGATTADTYRDPGRETPEGVRR